MSAIRCRGNGERVLWLRSLWPGGLGFTAVGMALIAAFVTIPNTHGDDSKFLVRQGATLNDAIGHFTIVNAGKPDVRFVFHTKSAPAPLIVLESQVLEGIYKLTRSDESRIRRWTVSGIYTEFRRENYLLITKAESHNLSAGRGLDGQ